MEARVAESHGALKIVWDFSTLHGYNDGLVAPADDPRSTLDELWRSIDEGKAKRAARQKAMAERGRR